MLTRVRLRPPAGVSGFGGGRVAAWVALVAVLAAVNYGTRFSGTSSSTGSRTELYTWSGAIGGALFYIIFFVFLYAIAAIDTDELFALRRPRSRSNAIGLSISIVVAIYVWSFVVSQLPLPQSPGKEQGITPTHWEPHFAKQYAANFVVIALVAPFVEELAFRGAGYRLLLGRYGRWPAILGVGVAFGLAHGLVEGLLILIPFGALLAYLRDRTDSVLPGMAVHFTFNAIALLAVLAS